METKRLKGFSLFEILIIISIASLLFIFSAVSVNGQLKKARDGKRKADLEKVKVALYDYFFDADCFPTNLPNCGESLTIRNTDYIKKIPCNSSGNSYEYQTENNDCPQWFKVLTNLENLNDSGITKTGCNFGCGLECDYSYAVSSSNIRANDGCITNYACDPSRECSEYEDPGISQCPAVFENDPTCNDACDDRDNRCHDSRGKRVPD